VSIDIVPVERLTRRSDRFRCDALHASLSASTCVARQLARHENGRNQHTHKPQEWAVYPTCASCSVGREIAARVPPDPPPVCKVCGVPVRGAGKRTPLCPAHRKAVAA
jgi:hypothetical protein